jgi:carbon storage regulator
MLVLSRQRDETIMIGDEIEITIVDIRGDKVRLGITAPRSVQVHRKEVYDAIKRENADASRVQVDDLKVADHSLREVNGRRLTRENHTRNGRRNGELTQPARGPRAGA